MSLFRHSKLFLATALVAGFPALASAEPRVVTSIKPVHSLVSAVMEGVGTPDLIVGGNSSPHDFALKPSQAQNLAEADLVFWIGPDLEAFLTKPLETIAAKAENVPLVKAKGITKLEFREGTTFDAHDHGHGSHDDHAKKDDDDGHDHDKHEDHDDHAKKDDHDGHDHDKHEDHDDHAKKDDHDGHDHDKHKDHDDHAGGHEIDPHVFLDPQNAKAMVAVITEELVHHDAKNAARYEANAAAVHRKLDALLKDIAPRMEKIKDPRFIVFHDAYHYFEARFGIEASGAITLSPEIAPSVARIKEIKDRITETSAKCVFTEPQFPSKLIDTVTEGTSAKTATLDPLGATLEDGPALYFKLIDNIAVSFEDCLTKDS